MPPHIPVTLSAHAHMALLTCCTSSAISVSSGVIACVKLGGLCKQSAPKSFHFDLAAAETDRPRGRQNQPKEPETHLVAAL